ncbi:MAG: restriction endonuclease subunit S [Caldilineales bacterium]|nr:restriction endonuclease subunit S [Caldilineales bacterium]
MHITSTWKTMSVQDCLASKKKSRHPSIPKTEYQETGTFPIIDQGQELIAGWTDSAEAVIQTDIPVVIFGDHTRIFKFIDFPFACGADGTKLLYPNRKLFDPEYFYYALLNVEVPNKGYNRHYRYLRELSLQFPIEKAEQRAIARALRTVQAARAARQREAALERERKAALMDYLFTHGTRGEPRKQTPIGEMPESWEVVELGKRCVVKTSFPSFKQILDLDTGKETDEIVLALKVSDMTLPGNDKYISNSNIDFHHPINSPSIRRFLKPNSVVFPKRGAAIATNKKRLTAHYAILDPNLIAIEPPDNIDFEYLFAFFERFDLRTLQANNPIPQLNKHNVEAVMLALPSTTEQKEISKVLGACDAKIAALDREIALLDELFQALLEELMTGRVRAGEEL